MRRLSRRGPGFCGSGRDFGKAACEKKFPWRQAYASLLTDLMRSPVCALGKGLLDEADALTVGNAAPQSAASLRAWAAALRDVVRPSCRSETSQTKARAGERMICS